MVKLTTLALAIASTLPMLASAANCHEGLAYCGYNLEKRGRYREDIARELLKHGYQVTNWSMKNSLFLCTANGGLQIFGVCNKQCIDGGSGQSDWCENNDW